MDIWGFAVKYLKPYKIKGSEIIPELCPYCRGGEHHDKYTAALNRESGAFNCKRGGCGKQVSFYQLCRDFGEEADRSEVSDVGRSARVYKKPETQVKAATDVVEKYLALRKISRATMDAYKVGSDGKGNIIFPFYENGELVFVKFRPARKLAKGERKAWREADTKPVLFGMDLCDPQHPLCIFEGECFNGNAEILTPDGWIALEKYGGQKVLQVSQDLTAQFVTPSAYVNKAYNGELIEIDRGGNYYSLTTPNHNLVFQENGSIAKHKANETPNPRWYVPTSVKHSGDGIGLNNNQIALYLAISADGTIDVRKNSGPRKALAERYVRFAFRKKRKVERLISILENLKIKYHVRKYSTGYDSICFSCPEWIAGKFLPIEFATKTTVAQKQFILDEMVYWDGNYVPGRNQTEYSTKNYHNAVVMQTIAHLCGKMSTIMSRNNKIGNWYKISILHGKQRIGCQKWASKSKPYSGNVYCVTVPSGMILVRQNGHISVSGNCDALSGYESEIPNCVSVPSGAEDLSWLDTCYDWLQQFKTIYLYGDNDDPGQQMVKKLTARLADHRVYVVNHECKDANELLYRQGREAVRAAYDAAKEVPVYGLIDLADILPLDVKNIPASRSGIGALDSKTGGFLMGDLSIWTGKRGEGKSTLLSQLMLEAVDQGQRVCAYSGELRADRFQYWVNLQAAGDDNVTSYRDAEKDREVYYVQKEILELIKAWYRGKFYLYDNAISDASEANSILKVFEYAAKRYDCNVFLVDNLMTARFDISVDNNYYRAQSNFVGQLVEFVNRYNVHIHLVAHPRKTHGGLENDDVSGTADITNRADNVFSLERLDDENRLKLGCDSVLKILKNRSEGATGNIGLNFSNISRRLFAPSVGNVRRYGWEKAKPPIPDWVQEAAASSEDCPF